MKRILIFYLFFLVQFSFAQKIEVVAIEKINDAKQDRFFYPKISPNNDYLLLTDHSYKGLTQYKIKSRKAKVLNDDLGAGYNVSMSDDGRKLLYNSIKLVNQRRHNALVEQDVDLGSKRVIEPFTRDVIKPMMIKSNPVYVKSGEMRMNKTLKSSNVKQLLLTIEDRNLVLYHNGARKILNPNGSNKSYIWPSISPDGKSIVYTVIGEGTYVANLNGSNVKFLGKLNAPKWMGNDYIVGMDDIDNGEVLLSSEIVISAKNGGFREILEAPKGVKAMYPSSSVDGKTIVFNSEIGEVYLMKLKIN